MFVLIVSVIVEDFANRSARNVGRGLPNEASMNVDTSRGAVNSQVNSSGIQLSNPMKEWLYPILN